MVKNEDIQKYVKEKYGFYPKNGWIAEAKEVYGIPFKRSSFRNGPRKWPCPKKHLKDLREAFTHFGLIEK